MTAQAGGAKSGQKAAKSPDLDCRQCDHYHDETKAEDEVVWGECWALPPDMVGLTVQDEIQAVSVIKTVQMPYRCHLFKPRLN